MTKSTRALINLNGNEETITNIECSLTTQAIENLSQINKYTNTKSQGKILKIEKKL